jgi:hypothetical protein
MHPLDYFDKVYVTNLASRVDRREEMTEQFQTIGRELNQRNIQLFEASRPENAGDFPSIGARGCFMSHLRILQDASAKGHARILIVEDDLNFAPDFVADGSRVIELLAKTDWAMFYGGYEALTASSPVVRNGLARLDPSDSLRTTHFVALQQPAIEEASAYLSAMLVRPAGDAAGGPMHVDGAYGWYRQAHPSRETWVAIPELGHQRSSRTDIHDLRWFDRWWLVRDAVAAVRRRRNAH